MKSIFKCYQCGKEFKKWASMGVCRYCSRKCYWESKKGKTLPHLYTPMILKKKADSLRGKPQLLQQNEKHHAWKGSVAGYTAFHQWLRRKFGNANRCEGKSRKPAHQHPKRFEWALIHGEEHDHNRKSYMQLCASCHRIYDNIKPKWAN